jgi:hypothetical protein
MYAHPQTGRALEAKAAVAHWVYFCTGRKYFKTPLHREAIAAVTSGMPPLLEHQTQINNRDKNKIHDSDRDTV